MPQVVELDAGQAGVGQRLAPPVADRVLMRRVASAARRLASSPRFMMFLRLSACAAPMGGSMMRGRMPHFRAICLGGR